MEITNEANSLHLEKIIFLSSIIAIKSLVCSLKLDVEFQFTKHVIVYMQRQREKTRNQHFHFSKVFYKLHQQEKLFQNFRRCLTVERCSVDLIRGGSLFHYLEPNSVQKNFNKFYLIILMVLMFKTCCLRAVIAENNNLKTLDINIGLR